MTDSTFGPKDWRRGWEVSADAPEGYEGPPASQATVFDFSLEGLLHLEAQPHTELTFALIREVRALLARIASLEAERDIWKDRQLSSQATLDYAVERANWAGVYLGVSRLGREKVDPTPSEIAAYVEQKRKAWTP